MTNEPEPNTRPLPQPSEDQPAPYTCKHSCERDALMDQLAKLQADGDKLAVAAEPFVDNMAYLDWLEAADDDSVDRPAKSAGDYRRLSQALTEWKDRA